MIINVAIALPEAWAIAHFSHHRTGLTAIVRERPFMENGAVCGVVFVSVLTGESVAQNAQIFDRAERALHIRSIWPFRCERIVQSGEIDAAGRR